MSDPLSGTHFPWASVKIGAFFFWAQMINEMWKLHTYFSQLRKNLSIRNFYEPRNFDQTNEFKYFHYKMLVLWYIWTNTFIQIYHSTCILWWKYLNLFIWSKFLGSYKFVMLKFFSVVKNYVWSFHMPFFIWL